MQKPERGTVASRLAVVRFGLMTIASISIAALVALTMVVYSGASSASNQVDANYSFSEYLGDVAPIMGLAIVIIIIVSVAIYFGYRAFLQRSEA